MPQKLPLLVLVVFLAAAGLYWGLGDSGDDDTAPEIQQRSEEDQGTAGARSVSDAGATRDDDPITRVDSTPDSPTDGADEGSAEIAAELSTRVRGRVMDIRSGDPVVGARVTLGRSSGKEGFAMIERELRLRDKRPDAAITDAEGRFDIGVRDDWIRDDMIRARVQHELYQSVASEPTDLRLEQVNDLGQLLATPAPMLSLEVVDDRNQPIAGAKIRTFDSSGPNVELLSPPTEIESEDGDVAISVSLSAEDFSSGEGEFGGNLFPVALGDLQGRVRLTEWTTDDEGRCRIPCEPGELGLRLTHDDHATTEARLIMPEQGGLSERVTMAKAALLRVIVTDSGGEPVVGRRIEARTELLGTRSEQTDDQGIATFHQLPIGTVRVRLGRKPRHGVFVLEGRGSRSGEPRPESIEAELFSGQDTEVRLTAAPRAITTITVTLDGQPLENARVSCRRVQGDDVEEPGFIALDGIFGASDGSRTDADGRITMTDLELGASQFTVRHRDLALTARTKAELTAGEQELRFDFVTSRIAGRVVDPEGNPVQGAAVSLIEEDNGSGAVGHFIVQSVSTTEGVEDSPANELLIGPNNANRTDVDGRFEFLLVPSTEALTVRVRADEGQGEFPQEVRPRAGERVDLGTLTLTSVGRAEIQVISDSEISVVVAQRLDASGEPTGDQQVQPARDGQVVFESLLPGIWRFRLGFGPTAVTVERQIFSGRTATLSIGQ